MTSKQTTLYCTSHLASSTNVDIRHKKRDNSSCCDETLPLMGWLPISVAVRCKSKLCCRSIAGSRVRIPLRAWMFVSWVCYAFCQKHPLGRADHSFWWVLPSVCVCVCVWSRNFNNEAASRPSWAVAPQKKKLTITSRFLTALGGNTSLVIDHIKFAWLLPFVRHLFG
jgi:hypothetical protein